VNDTPGSGFRLANIQAPAPLRESITAAYQNLISQNRQLVGDRDPKQRELVVQVRAMDASNRGASLGVPALLALCSAILQKSLRGGLAVVGGLTIGGSLEPLHNAVDIAELAAERGVQTLLVPVSCRRQVNEMSDDLAARLTVVYYLDARDALLKALVD
jgi:ATP-dependent Lon protease